MRQKVERILERIRPALLKDRLQVEFFEYSDAGLLKLSVTGGDPEALHWLRQSLERSITAELPEIKRIELQHE